MGLALVLVMFSLVGCSPQSTITGEIKGIDISSQQKGIWVTGQGKVAVVPDIAILRLGIEAQEESVTQAQAMAIEVMGRVMSTLTQNGVAEKDIQTQHLSIQKINRWDDKSQREVIIGYKVTNIVTAEIRDIDKTGVIIDTVAEVGGDLTRIDSIGFSVDDPSVYYGQAREKAMADTKGRAEQIAKLAGITLGKPIYISESAYFQSPSPVRMAEAIEVPSTPISAGEMEISLNLQAVYAILK
ncbi:SIMPL domain-containing protein [Chloroflexota bacterium]